MPLARLGEREIKLAPEVGLEPTTSALTVPRNYQLCYSGIKLGAPGGSRTRKIWFLRPTRMPIPSPRQKLDQLPALPGPGLSCYTVRMSFFGADIPHPRVFQGSRILGLVVAAKLYRAHPGVMVLPMTHFLQVKV